MAGLEALLLLPVVLVAAGVVVLYPLYTILNWVLADDKPTLIEVFRRQRRFVRELVRRIY